MILISKYEAKKLHEEYKIQFSQWEGISRSKSRHGKHSKYYLCESRDGYNLDCLKKIRSNK